MKFIVDKVELRDKDDFKYFAIFDSSNKNWYEEQKKFKDTTLKILYNSFDKKILSISKDVSMLAPTVVGDVVEEVENINIDFKNNLHYIEGKIVELSIFEEVINGKIKYSRDKEIDYNNSQLTYLRKKYTELKVAKLDSEELEMDTSDIDIEIAEVKSEVIKAKEKLKELEGK